VELVYRLGEVQRRLRIFPPNFAPSEISLIRSFCKLKLAACLDSLGCKAMSAWFTLPSSRHSRGKWHQSYINPLFSIFMSIIIARNGQHWHHGLP
jgi:hypothetical protein